MDRADQQDQGRGERPLEKRLRALGRELGAREAEHTDSLSAARSNAEKLHAIVADALATFHDAAAGAGAPHLQVELSAPRLDDKHVRAVEFELARGRHRAIVTVKSRGEVTLVGPFRAGKNEGPCRSFPCDAMDELDGALGDFLSRFLEEASTP
ncbi:MAG: hypothetical protein MJE66_18975 [Proteobacteria bacterium]|nr:hypothetical protein [Pseudomonadota bacterium]